MIGMRKMKHEFEKLTQLIFPSIIGPSVTALARCTICDMHVYGYNGPGVPANIYVSYKLYENFDEWYPMAQIYYFHDNILGVTIKKLLDDYTGSYNRNLLTSIVDHLNNAELHCIYTSNGLCVDAKCDSCKHRLESLLSECKYKFHTYEELKYET